MTHRPARKSKMMSSNFTTPTDAFRPSSRLTRADVQGLELFDRLVELHGRTPGSLVRDVVKRDVDSVRRSRGKLRTRIHQRCGGRCFYCGIEVAEDAAWHGDHVIPHAHGGQTNEWNGVVACAACNAAKSDKVW